MLTAQLATITMACVCLGKTPTSCRVTDSAVRTKWEWTPGTRSVSRWAVGAIFISNGRVHIACWAARHALYLPGDFVECGVNTGILSLAICNYVEFNSTGKSFFLFDTYSGIPADQMLESERADRLNENRSMYNECYDIARRNFRPFPRASIGSREGP